MCCFNFIYDKILEGHAQYYYHHLDLLSLIPRNHKNFTEAAEFSYAADILEAAQRVSQYSGLLLGQAEEKCDMGSLGVTLLFDASTATGAYILSTLFPPFTDSCCSLYLTLCRVCSRFRFLSSSNFLFSILASKLASSEATLLSRSLVFCTCAYIEQETVR